VGLVDLVVVLIKWVNLIWFEYNKFKEFGRVSLVGMLTKWASLMILAWQIANLVTRQSEFHNMANQPQQSNSLIA
jgi:hypothetical protein